MMARAMRPKATQIERAAAATHNLLQTTIGLIAERGVDGFSIADVAERAGVSRGLPGHHFKTREVLVLEAAKVVLQPAKRSEQLGLEPLLVWFASTLRAVQTPSPSTRAQAVLMTAVALPPDVKAHVRTCAEAATALVQAHLMAGVEQGAVRRSLDAVAHAHVLIAALAGQLVLAAKSSLSDAEVETFLAIASSALRPDASQPRPSRLERPKAKAASAQPGLFD